MIVRLIEATSEGGGLHLEEVYINSEQVVCVREAPKPYIYENKYPEGLDKRTEFSRVYLDHGQNGLTLTVVGSPTLIESKFNAAKQQLLKG